MGISHAIKAMAMAGEKISSQVIGDFAMQVWRDRQAAMKAGRFGEALNLEQEFDALCALFQER